MTEEFETNEMTKTLSEQENETLSTRELMEKNWDLFVKEEEAENASSSEPQAPQQEMAFDAVSYLNESFEGLKETLNTRGIGSLKDWLESLVELEKLYQDSPKELIKQLALSAGFELPKKEAAADILTAYALKNNIPHEKMMLALQQKQSSLKEGDRPQMIDKSFVQQLIKEELSAYLKEKTNETQKAKNSSFSPKGVGLKASLDSAYTKSGKPKTTREILEEGWRLLGL